MCVIYSCRFNCGCVSPGIEEVVYGDAFQNNKSCEEKKHEIILLPSICSKSCPGWDNPEDTHREQYKDEITDSHLYYGNNDISQEDIYFDRAERSPKRPQHILASYSELGMRPVRTPSERSKSDPGDLEHEIFDNYSLPHSPSTSSSGSRDSEVNPDAVFTSHHESWETRRPKGHGRTIRYFGKSKK